SLDVWRKIAISPSTQAVNDSFPRLAAETHKNGKVAAKCIYRSRCQRGGVRTSCLRVVHTQLFSNQILQRRHGWTLTAQFAVLGNHSHSGDFAVADCSRGLLRSCARVVDRYALPHTGHSRESVGEIAEPLGRLLKDHHSTNYSLSGGRKSLPSELLVQTPV